MLIINFLLQLEIINNTWCEWQWMGIASETATTLVMIFFAHYCGNKLSMINVKHPVRYHFAFKYIRTYINKESELFYIKSCYGELGNSFAFVLVYIQHYIDYIQSIFFKLSFSLFKIFNNVMRLLFAIFTMFRVNIPNMKIKIRWLSRKNQWTIPRLYLMRCSFNSTFS